MKILLIAPESYYLPVGLAFISASLKRGGHEVDTCYIGQHDEFLGRQGERFDFIATGGMSSQLHIMRTARDIAREYGCKFVCGGPIISADPLTMARLIRPDYAVVGEGETTILELLKCLESGGELDAVQGVIYQKDGDFVKTPERVDFPPIDAIPRPDLDGFGFAERLDRARPFDVYYLDLFDNPRDYPLITSRTCPFSCTFCFQPENRKYRVRDLDDVIDELRDVVFKYRINVVTIVDELFHAKNSRLIEFCEKFKAFRETVPWDLRWSCQARVAHMTEELLDKMSDSGCFMISYGIESYSETVLKSMRKNIKPEMIDSVIPATLRRGISVQGNFIFGDTAETLDTAQETLDYWRAHPEYGIVLYHLLPVPGSAIYHLARKKGLLPDLDDFLINRYFAPQNLTSMSYLDYMEMRRRVLRHELLFTKWQAPLRISRTSVEVRCSHCSAVNHYRNCENNPLFFHTMTYCRSCRLRYFIGSAPYRAYAQIVGHLVFHVYLYIAYLHAFPLLRAAYRSVRRFFRGDWGDRKTAASLGLPLPAASAPEVGGTTAIPLRELASSRRRGGIDVKAMREASRIKSNV